MPLPFDVARCTGKDCPSKGICARAELIPEAQRLVPWLGFHPMADHPGEAKCILFRPIN